MHWPPSSGSESMIRQLACRMPGPERGREPDRAGADDRDVDGLVAHAAGSASVSGVPSSALSARSTEVETQVNVGVSRFV